MTLAQCADNPAEDAGKQSPDYVRISAAAAMELRLVRGRFLRDCSCGCINLLQNYDVSCTANCTYCGLARTREGESVDKSFIRVDWPLYPTSLVAEKVAEKEARSGVGRVCVSQVHHPRAYPDLIAISQAIHQAAPAVPLSALVSASTLNEERLVEVKDVGVDIIGVGLDAVTPELFSNTRGKGAKGPHSWEYHWKMIRAARRLFGPMKVNCHIMVGLGETDRDLMELFHNLKEEQIAAYLFSFNPEEGTAMEAAPRAPLHRLRRVQLVKNLVEEHGLPREAVGFNDAGEIARLEAPELMVRRAIAGGKAFMTDGCPDRQGEMTCNRPYGSYRPGEPFRDYPFRPEADDLAVIGKEMRLEDIWRP
ncbi:MAG: radical SAM protein [Deltaproteobacteria bacterium]|nr:radical SAM protein [Deltaproteobacteria bacterium]